MKAIGVGALLAGLVAMLTLPVLPAVASASEQAVPSDVNDFSFESFDADYYLDLDEQGYVHTRVVETIVALFPPQQNRGIIRAIPDESRGYPLNLQMLSITDENGTPVYFERYDTSQWDSATEEYIPFAEFYLGTDEYVEGRTTYVLEYSLDSTITNVPGPGGANVDEFYWDVNGNGWGQSFGEVTARIHLGPALQNALEGHTACYTGEYGSDGTCNLHRIEDGYQVTVNEVYPYSTVTVAVAFKDGTVTQRTLPQDSWIVQIAPKVIFGIVAVCILIGLILRLGVWRNPRPGLLIAQYDPPEQDILVSAEVLGRSSRAFSALLIDFAVRGIIRIVDQEPNAAATTLGHRYELELVDSSTTTPRELKVITLLFGKEAEPGKKVNPGSIGAKTGASLFNLTAETARYAEKEGYRVLPSDRLPRILRRVAAWPILLFIPIWVYAFWNDIPDGGPITLFMWLSIIGWIVLAIVLVRPKQLTEKGAQAKDYLLGMREYLTVAEEARLRFLQSPQGAQRRIDPTDKDAIVHLYERLLPYAVLWGVEKEWAQVLRLQYQDTTPAWYSGDALTPAFFSSFSSSAMTRVHPIVTSSSGGSSGGSSWSSSGSSSFSSGSFGGGFSGGGGGGGGGGGR